MAREKKNGDFFFYFSLSPPLTETQSKDLQIFREERERKKSPPLQHQQLSPERFWENVSLGTFHYVFWTWEENVITGIGREREKMKKNRIFQEESFLSSTFVVPRYTGREWVRESPFGIGIHSRPLRYGEGGEGRIFWISTTSIKHQQGTMKRGGEEDVSALMDGF